MTPVLGCEKDTKMRNSSLFGALTLAVSFPVCASAQQDGGLDIVVTGERSLESNAIRDAVRDMSSNQRFDEPLVRFHDPVCLAVSGLGRVASNYVVERMAGNARAAGVPIADEGCRPNALVLIVDDPVTLVARIQETQPRLISRAKSRQLDAALARGETVLVWHNEEPRGEDGEALRVSSNVPGMPVTGPFSQLAAETHINTHGRARRIDVAGSRAVINGVVILNIERLVDMDLERVADYATMRLLAPGMQAARQIDVAAEEPASGGPQTILEPFVAGRGVERMTSFDRAWLSALYDLAPNAGATRLPGAVAQMYASDEE